MYEFAMSWDVVSTKPSASTELRQVTLHSALLPLLLFQGHLVAQVEAARVGCMSVGWALLCAGKMQIMDKMH